MIDVARDICKLFSIDPETNIKFVENRPFNDQRYFLDDQKLKNLGWSERTHHLGRGAEEDNVVVHQ